MVPGASAFGRPRWTGRPPSGTLPPQIAKEYLPAVFRRGPLSRCNERALPYGLLPLRPLRSRLVLRPEAAGRRSERHHDRQAEDQL